MFKEFKVNFMSTIKWCMEVVLTQGSKLTARRNWSLISILQRELVYIEKKLNMCGGSGREAVIG